jgi:hypothetical protein
MKGQGQGRPRLGPSIPQTFWALVELMRDKQSSTARFSARQGCARLAKELARDLQGGRFVPAETIRRFHKSVEAAIRDSAVEREKAAHLLEIGRQRRAVMGWDASVWLLLFDPTIFEGYEVTELRGDKFVAKRKI